MSAEIIDTLRTLSRPYQPFCCADSKTVPWPLVITGNHGLFWSIVIVQDQDRRRYGTWVQWGKHQCGDLTTDLLLGPETIRRSDFEANLLTCFPKDTRWLLSTQTRFFMTFPECPTVQEVIYSALYTFTTRITNMLHLEVWHCLKEKPTKVCYPRGEMRFIYTALSLYLMELFQSHWLLVV